MILSTRGRYGLKMMLELALNYGKGTMPLKDIANKQLLSDSYLEQLVSPLRKNSLVISIRGAQGGYELARRPEEITVGEILRILEGPLTPSDCVLDEDPECDRAGNCVTRIVWEKITEGINNVVDSITLGDMLSDYHKMNKNNECREK